MSIQKLAGLRLDTEEHKGKWFLTWLGQVSHNADTGTREVILWFLPLYESRLTDGVTYDDPKALGKAKLIERKASVGDLPFLSIGMVIDTDGKIIDVPRNYSNNYRKFEIEDVQSEKCQKYLHQVIHQGKRKISEQNPSDDQHKVYANFPFPYKANGCPCFIFEVNDMTVIIPKFEIARYFLFPTSKLCKSIFSQKTEELYWIDEEERGSNRRDKNFIVAKGITPKEAATLANIGFIEDCKKSTNYIVNSIRHAYNKLRTEEDTVNVFFNTQFPFKGRCSIYSLGRDVEYDGKKFFLVYQLLDTDYKLPYDSVNYDFYEDNRSGENKNDPNLEQKNYLNIKHVSLPSDLDFASVDLANSPQQNSDTTNIEYRIESINYFDTKTPKIKANRKLLQDYKHNGKDIIIGKKFESLSTKEGQADANNIGKGNVIIKDPTDIEGEDYLQYFFNLVTTLDSIFKTKYLNINTGKAIKDFRISYLPTSDYKAIDISDHLHFCYYNPFENKKILRRLSIAELNIDDIYFYLIEIDSYGLGNNVLRTATVYEPNLRKINHENFPNPIINLLRYTVRYEGNFSRMHDEEVFKKLNLNSARSNHNFQDKPEEVANKQILKMVSIIKKARGGLPAELQDYGDS